MFCCPGRLLFYLERGKSHRLVLGNIRLVGEDRAQLDRSLGIDHGLLHLHNVHFDAGSAYKLIILVQILVSALVSFLEIASILSLSRALRVAGSLLGKMRCRERQHQQEDEKPGATGIEHLQLSKIYLSASSSGKAVVHRNTPAFEGASYFRAGVCKKRFSMKPGARAHHYTRKK